MQMLKLFCLLISFQLFSSLLIQDKINSIQDDIINCLQQEDKTQCPAYKFESKYWQCCSQKTIDKYNDEVIKEEELCTFGINPIQPGIDESSTENGKTLLKEISGYDYFRTDVEKNVTSQEMKMSCGDGDLSMVYNLNDFTEEEKARFKSDNLCMRFFMNDTEKVVDENTCYDSIVATANEGSGISCGFYDHTLYFSDNTSEKFNTCFLFNDDIIKNKNMGFWIKMITFSNSMRKSVELEKLLSHYTVSFSKSKGKNLIYDSTTDTVIIDGDSEEEEQGEEGKQDEKEEERKEEERKGEEEKEGEKEGEKDEEKEGEKENEREKEEEEKEEEKEDEGSDTDTTGPSDSSNFIAYRYLFFLAILLI